jgi:ASC-1-like (ASCH) protein/RimJ/RimL family protein N-acetyltransferase
MADSKIEIRQATENDIDFVINLMDNALSPYYGGDHRAHARRIFDTHISGGKDKIGHFSFEQRMFIIILDDIPVGMIHLVGKRQGTYKISPLIISPSFQGKSGLGTIILKYAEDYAQSKGARQIYCTVAEQNNNALQFFLKKGYIVAGRSDSHYKANITEIMLYKLLLPPDFDEKFDRPHISVLPFETSHEKQVRELLLKELPKTFGGIDNDWITSLFEGFKRRNLKDINKKFKLIYVAIDRSNEIFGVAGSTPKKGEPIKVMPLVAKNLQAFIALITDIPYLLKEYGNKIYIHISPSPDETMALQQRGWSLDAALPAAYRDKITTQQWSLNIRGEDFMRLLRVKKSFIDLVKAGKKRLEVRVGYSNIKSIQRGERIKFASRVQELIIRVVDIRKYKTFDEMGEYEDTSLIADLHSKEEVLSLLKEIYPKEKEKLGVIVLEIAVEKVIR